MGERGLRAPPRSVVLNLRVFTNRRYRRFTCPFGEPVLDWPTAFQRCLSRGDTGA